jgi:hypothetical protein
MESVWNENIMEPATHTNGSLGYCGWVGQRKRTKKPLSEVRQERKETLAVIVCFPSSFLEMYGCAGKTDHLVGGSGKSLLDIKV